MTVVRMDLTTIFEAIAAEDTQTIVRELANGLLEDLRPSEIIGRVGLAAALGDTTGEALPVLIAAGKIGDWIRIIPPGSEPGAERRQKLLPIVPMTAALQFARQSIAKGYTVSSLSLGDPLFPKEISHAEGPWGELRDAILASDTALASRVLMGFYGSGTDYREIEGSLFFALNARVGVSGRAMQALVTLLKELEFAEWGNDHAAMLFQWILPAITQKEPEVAGAQEVRAYLSQPAHDLDFVRKRLALSNLAAAGEELRTMVSGGTTQHVLDAVFTAFQNGATGPQIAAQIAIVAAEHLAQLPLDMPELLHAGVNACRYVHGARVGTYHVQDVRVLPVVFHAANVVNQTITSSNGSMAIVPPAQVSSPLAGGLIEHMMLRTITRHIATGDEASARASIKRYTGMAFSGRTLAGTLGLAAAHYPVQSDVSGRTLLAIEALGEEFNALPLARQAAEGVALMYAAVHIMKTQSGDQSFAQTVESLL